MISSCLRIKYQHLYKFQEGPLLCDLSASHLTLYNSVVTHCCSQNGVFFSVPLPCPALPCLLAFVKAVSFTSVIASFYLFSGKLTSAPCMFVSKKHFLTFLPWHRLLWFLIALTVYLILVFIELQCN